MAEQGLRVGLCGIGLDAYWPQFEGLQARLEGYVRRVGERLEKAALRHTVRWHWVKGHHGHDANERADELAREGMAPFLGDRHGAGGTTAKAR